MIRRPDGSEPLARNSELQCKGVLLLLHPHLHNNSLVDAGLIASESWHSLWPVIAPD